MTKDIKLDNTSAHDIAGGNIEKTITHIYGGAPSPLTELLTKLAEGEDEETKDFIDKLKHFISESDNENGKVIGLSLKLTNGGATDNYITYATELKEEFAKLLEQNATNLHTQEIFAHLMSSIRMKFIHQVRPHLDHKPCQEVLDILYEKVIIPTIQLVVPNPLQLNDETIAGMLFYLTGNCHLEWGNAGI